MYDIMVKNSVYSKFKQERRFEDIEFVNCIVNE